jgi:hypothetical protein
MPLGNLTSQFFANVYLNELDQFVKHKLKIKYYIRYVDDFVIFHNSKEQLKEWKKEIDKFLRGKLELELHPNKSKVLKLNYGINFLGFRIFFYHKLIRKSNFRNFEKKFNDLKILYKENIMSREKVVTSLEGWLAYTSHANTYKYRRHLIRIFNQFFPIKSQVKINNIKKYKNFTRKIKESEIEFSVQKTLLFHNRGLNINQIAEQRNIKESTVWEHLANLIEHNQLYIWDVLPRKKVFKIHSKIKNKKDRLKEIRDRLKDNSITFDEINCVLSSVKANN